MPPCLFVCLCVSVHPCVFALCDRAVLVQQEAGHSKSLPAGRSDRLGDVIGSYCKQAMLARKEFVFVYNGKLVQVRSSPIVVASPSVAASLLCRDPPAYAAS